MDTPTTENLSQRALSERGLTPWQAAYRQFAGAVADTTRAIYESHLRLFAAYHCQRQVPVDEILASVLPHITPGDIRAWQQFMVEAGLQPGTINGRISSLSTLCGILQRAGLRSDNPCAGVARLPVTPKDLLILTPDQVRAMLRIPDQRTVTGARDYALLLAYLTGTADARALRWGEPVAPPAERAIHNYLTLAGRACAAGECIFTATTDAAMRLPHVGDLAPDRPITRQRAAQIIKGLATRAGIQAERVTLTAVQRTAERHLYQACDADLAATARLLEKSPAQLAAHLHRPTQPAPWVALQSLYGF